MSGPAPRPIILLGPTAGGKSDLALGLALRLGGQIISADSMQVYRRLDAGTAKPSPQQRAQAPHHLIDCIEPTEPFTVADWLTAADAILHRLGEASVPGIVVGGTNLYIKALLEGLFEGPPPDEALRGQLALVACQELHTRLQAVDPPAAARIHPNDRKRLTRALEVHHLTGKPISQWQTQWSDATATPAAYRWNPILLGLHWPVEAINQRINLRVKAMFFPDKARRQDGLDWWPQQSLVDETRQLEEAGLLGPQAREALGYKQVLEHLAGVCTLEDAFEKTKVQTRRYAKQQRTWLRRFASVRWLDAADRSSQALLEAALAALTKHDTDAAAPLL